MNTPSKSALELDLLFQMRAVELPQPEFEYQFAEGRKWRFDFAWLDQMIAVEVEGGTWVRGSHTRGVRFEKDCEKYNTAALLGWKVLRFTTDMVTDGRALAAIEQALG